MREGETPANSTDQRELPRNGAVDVEAKDKSRSGDYR
jgi:sec-independent protein translocase protein TatA